MKKLLLIIVLGLLFGGSGYAEIVFRADCENPKGVRFSESIAHLKNDELISSYYEKDQFTGNDIIELIYDNSNPKQIQVIWGEVSKFHNLHAANENFYHWGFIDKNFGNGFYWGHWSLSLPNKTLTYYKGNTSSTGIGTGIANGLYSSKCKIR